MDKRYLPACVALLACVTLAARESSSKEELKFGVEAAQRGLWREAVFRWEKIVKAETANGRLRNNLGVAYESLGRLDRALEEYREAHRLLPESREVRSNLHELEEFCRGARTCGGEIPQAEESPAEVPRDKRSKEAVRVTLEQSIPARLDLEGLKLVLVTRFRVESEVPEINLDKEIVTLLRRELRKRTRLEILDVEPPALPEQPFAELLANTGFWRSLADQHGADLILSGTAGFSVSDRSGFVQQDEISPLTGQRVRRSRFVEREGFALDLRLLFLRGATGAVLYEDHFTGENTFAGRAGDRLTTVYALFEQFEQDILGIVATRTKTAQRYLFTE